MRIPNICIHIPGTHSRTLFFPRYTLDLFKRLWNPLMTDPTHTVKSIKFPKGTSAKFKTREVVSLESEKEFWQGYFKDGSLFDICKPGHTFEDEFEALIEEMADAKPEEEEEDEKIVIPEEISALSIPPEVAQALVRSGFKTLASISRASLSDIMETEGMEAPMAKAIREQALAEVGDAELVVTETEE